MNRAQRRFLAATTNKARWGEWEERRFTPGELAGLAVENLVTAFVNELFSVQVYDCATSWGPVRQLSIRKHVAPTAIGWDDLQRIKNELAGESIVAVEVFPRASDLIDQAPMRHLWCLPEGIELPFGLHMPNAWGRR